MSGRTCYTATDGSIFIDDVSEGDIWYFPAGYPHSIQGLGPDGCEFLLVFDQGMFSEDNTFLISDWLAHTPPSVVSKNLNLPAAVVEKLPKEELYIFPSTVPGQLADDRAEVGGQRTQSGVRYTFKMKSMPVTKETKGGHVQVVDSRNFPVSRNIAAGLVTIKPGGIRELHWHPNSSEWQFYLAGNARMTVFEPVGNARTMDFNANDVGYVPVVAGHYIENTGDTDLVFLEMLKANEFLDFSLNNWIRRLPQEMVSAHLNLDENEIKKIPAEKLELIA
jgi:oxalate decarboxylase